jgi:hypothetical protein
MATKTKTRRMAFEVKTVKQFKGKTYIGQVDYKKKLITVALYGGITGEKLTRYEVLQAYYHEVVHFILHDMKHPLNNNEKFVDDFAKRMRWWAVAADKQNAKDKKDADNLVTQRPEGLRKLRKEVPRSKSAKKVQAR